MEQSDEMRTILDSLGEAAVYVVREDNHQILYYNQKFKSVIPQAEEGLICHELRPGVCRNCPLNNMDGKERNITVSYDNPFGKLVSIQAVRMKWGKEQIPAFTVCVIPHAAQEQIRKLGTEAIYNYIPAGVVKYRMDDDFTVLDCSREYQEMFGADTAGCLPFVLEEDRSRVISLFHAMANSGRPIETEYRVKKRNGQIVWIRVNGRMSGVDSGYPVYYFTMQDVTRQQKGRKALEEERRILVSSVIELLGELLVVDLHTGDYRLYKDEEGIMALKGEPDFNSFNWRYGRRLIHPEDQQRFFDMFSPARIRQQVAHGKKRFSQELRRKMSDGQYRWCELLGVVMDEEDGNKVLLSFRDIDELHKAREQYEREEREQKERLEKALGEAERANRAKSDFLSRMSHDIRSPMNTIMGMTAIAGANLDSPDKIADCLKKIDISSKYLVSLINDILDMSKIESGKMEMQEAAFDIVELLKETAAVGGAQASEKNQKFILEIDEGISGSYMGDALRIRQVLLNLLSNAVKYTNTGGKIWLSVTRPGWRGEKELIDFAIEDTGVGISEPFMRKLFEPFEQENSSSGRVMEGSGLGLPISKSLTEMMGGSIQVRSHPGKGSCFHVALPLLKVAAESEPPKRDSGEEQERDYRGVRLLLVEDNELNVEIARTIMEMRSFLVEVARNGRDAVEMVKAVPPWYYDVILMDIRMPVMGGLEAARKIRALDKHWTKEVPIIAMTANAFLGDKEEAQQAGMNDYLSKPVDWDLFYTVLDKYLRRDNDCDEGDRQ